MTDFNKFFGTLPDEYLVVASKEDRRCIRQALDVFRDHSDFYHYSDLWRPSRDFENAGFLFKGGHQFSRFGSYSVFCLEGTK